MESDRDEDSEFDPHIGMNYFWLLGEFDSQAQSVSFLDSEKVDVTASPHHDVLIAQLLASVGLQVKLRKDNILAKKAGKKLEYYK